MNSDHLILLDMCNSLDILGHRIGATTRTLQGWLKGFKLGLYIGTASLIYLTAWKFNTFNLPVWG